MTYINPNYYGFSASAFLLLEDFETSCDRKANTTEIECYPESGEYILKRFDFDEINPYYNILVSEGERGGQGREGGREGVEDTSINGTLSSVSNATFVYILNNI